MNIGGVGGYALNYSLNKFFLGGGGGCGHGNDLGEMAGAAGGGIIYILANTIIGNGHSLNANGANAPECTAPSPGCQNDGGGGGGGGGLIYNTASSVTGVLAVNAHGGKGSNIYVSPNTTEVAPGGGGGGGLIAFISGSYTSSVTFNISAGNAGILPQFSNSNYGASSGNGGSTMSSAIIPLPTQLYSNSQITAAFTDTLIRCTTYQFTNQSGSTGGIASVSWNFGAGSTSTAQNPTYTFPGPGTYTVVLTVTDNNGCSSSITRNVTVKGVAPASFTDSLLACNSVRLTNTSPASLTSFQWDFGTGTTSATRSPDYVFPGIGTYTVTLKGTDSNGCTSSVSHSIAVVHGVHADFSWSPTPAEIHIPVEFSNSSTGATHYNWNLGDGTVTMVTSPSHTYNTVDTVQVCLVAKDDLGCSDSACKSVEVDGPISIGVPSAFTPNGDGTNDVLYVKGSGIRQMHFIIFNRWGQKIFESTSQDKGWDGTFNGTPQEIEVYAYVLSATFYNGNSTTKKGNINLLR